MQYMFIKGVSGNPSGKKKGTLNKRTELAKLLDPHAENLVAKVIELALEGDITALRICMERLIPRARRESIGIEFTADEGKMKKNIFRAVLDGRLEVNEAEKILALFKSQSCVVSDYKINTTDPVEASKIYQQIMAGTYKG
jgi:hypothetical protein